MELADRLIATGAQTKQATAIKIAAMRELADRQINATARNYYLVCATDMEATAA